MTKANNTTRNLLLDCDGVMLDWLGGFIGFAEDALGRTIDPAGPDDFDLSGWLGVDGDGCKQLVRDFNEGEGGYFGRLKPMPGAVDALRTAHEHGRRISIVTACSTTPRVIRQREQNLRNVFGDIFRDIHAVDLAASKREILSQYQDVSWVEDKFENALLGAEIGHPSYLIRTSYNRKYEAGDAHPLMTWVDGWDCIRHHEALL